MGKLLILLSLSIISVIMLISIVNAGLVEDKRFPSAFTTITSTSVNFTFLLNITGTSETVYNLTVYNKSSSGGTFQYLFDIDLINGTHNDTAFTLKDTERTFWFYNVTNSTAGAFVSSTRLFDVDTEFLIFRLGNFDTLNFTLDTGDITIAGAYKGDTIQLDNTTAYVTVCDGDSEGRIIYNRSVRQFLGCNGLVWTNLTSAT